MEYYRFILYFLTFNSETITLYLLYHVKKKLDENRENCETFLDKCDGMSAFMDCIELNKPTILCNMMGVLGSLA